MLFVFFFFDEEVNIEIKRYEDGTILLDSIPYLKLEDKWPGYFEWYGIEEEDNIRIFRRTSELCFQVKKGRGFTDKDYYIEIYSWFKNYKGHLLDRESVYRLVKKYYDSKYKVKEYWNYTLLIPKNLESYKIDKSYLGGKEDGKNK